MAHAVIPEEELKPIVDSMKKVFSPIFKIGPAVIKIPQELKRIGDNLREDVSSGIPERFERACDKLEDMNEKFVMDFGGKVLSQVKESRDIANQQVERLLKEGIPAVVTETNEVRILNEKEVLTEQVKLLKTQDRIEQLQIEREKLSKQAMQGEEGSQEKLLKVLDKIEKYQQIEQQRIEKLPQQMIPRKGEGEDGEDYMPGPVGEFFGSIKDTLTAPIMAFQELGTTVKEFAKPFSGLVAGAKELGGDDGKGGILFFLGKTLKLVAAYIMASLIVPLLALATPLAIVTGAFVAIKTAIELVIKAFTSAYNFIAGFVPGMDKIGQSDDEKVVEKVKDKPNAQLTDDELASKSRIAERTADEGDRSGFKYDFFTGKSKREMADELKQQQDMRTALEDKTSNPLMNIINNQTNSSTTVETKVSPSPSRMEPEAVQ
jgi:ubiquitin